jgi:hypothetical protein
MAVGVKRIPRLPKGPALDRRIKITSPAITGGRPYKVWVKTLMSKENFVFLKPKYVPIGIPIKLEIVVLHPAIYNVNKVILTNLSDSKGSRSNTNSFTSNPF